MFFHQTRFYDKFEFSVMLPNTRIEIITINRVIRSAAFKFKLFTHNKKKEILTMTNYDTDRNIFHSPYYA